MLRRRAISRTNKQLIRITHPYFFIVGAGISAPEIPLAGGIIEHCKKKAKSFCNSKTEENELISRGDVYSEKSAKYYSYWFGTAYKNKIQRQQANCL